MDQQATYDDVKLILHLYELRREGKLREARKWFAKFNARTFAEKNELCPPGDLAAGRATMSRLIVLLD